MTVTNTQKLITTHVKIGKYNWYKIRNNENLAYDNGKSYGTATSDIYVFLRRKCIPNHDQQDATVTQFIYIRKLLYMFRVYPPPIIRSTKLYLQYPVFVKPLLLPATIVEESKLNSSTIAAGSSNGLINTGCCRYSVMLLMMGGGYTRNM